MRRGVAGKLQAPSVIPRGCTGEDHTQHPTRSPLVRLSLGHLITTPFPRYVVVHAAVSAEQRAACPEEDRDAHVSRLHY